MVSDDFEFNKLPFKKRLKFLKDFAKLSRSDIKILSFKGPLESKISGDAMENSVGATQTPVAIATNFRINGKDYLVPMATDDVSAVYDISHAAKCTFDGGGFVASSGETLMIGQIQLMGVKNVQKAKRDVLLRFDQIKSSVYGKCSAHEKDENWLKSIEVRDIDSHRGKIVVVHIIIDVHGMAGAGVVNAYCEAAAPYLEKLTGGRSVLKTASSLAAKRLVRVSATWKKNVIGKDVIESILDAYAFAKSDPFQAATYNRCVMGGVDSVLIAAANDWRSAEAGAHAYAALKGSYGPLVRYEKNNDGDLVGHIELPLAVGILGDSERPRPVSKVLMKILGAETSKELAEVVAAAGLANNFASLYVMVKENIRKELAEMRAEKLAANAGARGKETSVVAKVLLQEGVFTADMARAVLKYNRHRMRKRKLRRLIKKIETRIEKVKRRRK